MPMKPVNIWASSYETKQKESFLTNVPFWGAWVNDNATGVEVALPYVSKGTPNAAVFTGALASLPASKSPVQTANILASAWQSWYLAITFPPSPPTLPFLTIATVVPSPTGVAAAYSTLLSGLTAELTTTPPDPNSAFKLKGIAFATLFQTATAAAGVQITGTAPGAPPVPLSLPLIPVL